MDLHQNMPLSWCTSEKKSFCTLPLFSPKVVVVLLLPEETACPPIMAYLVACCRDKSGLHMVEYDGTDWPVQLVTGFAKMGCSIFLLLLFSWWWKESLRPLPLMVVDDEVKMLFEDVDKALLSFRRNFALLFWNQTYEKRNSKSLIQNAFLCMLFCTNEYKMGQLSVKPSYPGHNMLFSIWKLKKKKIIPISIKLKITTSNFYFWWWKNKN